MTAVAEARALGLSPREVTKTPMSTTPEGFVRAVVPASKRLDLRKVRTILDEERVDLASEEVLAGAYPEFALGAVPPLVGDGGDRVLVDRRLRESDGSFSRPARTSSPYGSGRPISSIRATRTRRHREELTVERIEA